MRLAKLWAEHQSLWSFFDEDTLAAKVRADLEEEFGPPREMPPVALHDLNTDPGWPWSFGDVHRSVTLRRRYGRACEYEREEQLRIANEEKRMRAEKRARIRAAQARLGLPNAAASAVPDTDGLVPLADRELFTISNRLRAKEQAP